MASRSDPAPTSSAKAISTEPTGPLYRVDSIPARPQFRGEIENLGNLRIGNLGRGYPKRELDVASTMASRSLLCNSHVRTGT
jgi:hypothetical protein